MNYLHPLFLSHQLDAQGFSNGLLHQTFHDVYSMQMRQFCTQYSSPKTTKSHIFVTSDPPP